MSGPTVLGIESTCDETAAAVISGRDLASNVVASSMDEHARYGGVIPEIASRAHAAAFGGFGGNVSYTNSSCSA